MTFLYKYKKWMIALVVLFAMLLLTIFLKIDISVLFADLHYVTDLLNEMFPPNFSIIWENNIVISSIIQTIAMAYLGTLLGGIIAFVLFSI